VTGALRPGTPREAGLDADRVHTIDDLIDEGIRTGVFPGAVGLVARGDVVGWHSARGDAQIAPAPRSVDLDTIYDLASLTKVIAALPVTLRLREQGELDLDAPVRTVLPAFSGGSRDRVTFRHLLAHTSGLPSWRALYLNAETRGAVLGEICRTPLQADPGAAVEYSDLGILLLGFALEHITQRRIDDLVGETVIKPFGLKDTMYNPPASLHARCAATETGHAYEREKVGGQGSGFPWRVNVLRGQVHDGNAHYAMGGIAPHAGLFSTAWEVATVAREWLRPGALVGADAVKEATTDQRHGAQGYPRGLGWVLHHEGTFFDALGARSFGHTGFTGTSMAIDPDEDLIVILLTNRVHLGGGNTKILEFRPRFHEAVRNVLM
jgi:CubicO group peptidase (beta-lactamase class C family)